MIYIYSTNPLSVTGGIAKSIQSLVEGFKIQGIEYAIVPTHQDGGRYNKYQLFIKSIINLFFIKRGSIIYLNAGGPVSLVRKGIVGKVAKLLGHKTVLHIHGPSLIDNLNDEAYQMKFSKICRSMDKVIVLTSWWVQQVSKYVPMEKISVLPNSLVVRNTPISDQKIKANFSGRTILFMARLEDGKGADLAIKVVERLKESVIKLK